MTTNNYHSNKTKELLNQTKITQGLNIYINNNYDVLTINHIITDDKQLQQRGIDRIVNIITTDYDSITLTVDDKTQNRSLNNICLPYLREYLPTGKLQLDYIANIYKLNDIIALYLIQDQCLILLDHSLLTHTLSTDELYLAYAEQYGFNNLTNEYYIYHNHVEARGNYKSYDYLQYYYNLTIADLLTDDLFFNAIIDIISLITNESILNHLINEYT